MRVFIALFTLFSLALAVSVDSKPAQVAQISDDCPPEEYPSITGSPATSTTQGYFPGTSLGLIPGGLPTGIPPVLPSGIPFLPPKPANRPVPSPDDSNPSTSCQSGSIHCCDTVHPQDSIMGRDLIERVNMNLARQLPLVGSVGVNCSPFSGAGIASDQW